MAKTVADVKNGEVVTGGVSDNGAVKPKRTRTNKKAHLIDTRLHLSAASSGRVNAAVENGFTAEEFIEMCIKGWSNTPAEKRGELYDAVIIDRTPPNTKSVTRSFDF